MFQKERWNLFRNSAPGIHLVIFKIQAASAHLKEYVCFLPGWNLCVRLYICSLNNVCICSLQKHDQGQVLLDVVFKHLDLTERDYFGLQLADESTDNPVSWLCL